MNKFRWLHHQNLLPWQRQNRPKRPHFQPFEANNFKTARWIFLIFIYFHLINITNICANFEKNLYIGFRDMSFLHKFKVALNSMYRVFWKIVKMFLLQIKQKHIENKNFHRVVYVISLKWSKIAYFWPLFALPWQQTMTSFGYHFVDW